MRPTSCVCTFQSLSGFQARCDAIFVSPMNMLLPSFNPCRVFKLVAIRSSTRLRHLSWNGFNPCRVFKLVAMPNTWSRMRLRRVVSIPVGFSSSLRLQLQCLGIQQLCRFNPCRVFKLVAIKSDKIHEYLGKIGFNPCRVFKLVAIPDMFHYSLQGNVVSIPVGFSSSLRF